MASPIPPVPIKGHCSIIYDNTLYVYSPDAFLALPLHKGGKWKKLKNGVSVSGATCVKQASRDSKEMHGLWVIGGTPTRSNGDYPGLQKFSFQTNTWETITPVVPLVTAGRLGHASVFLPGTSELLVYAGYTDGTPVPSSATFTISTFPPYAVNSFQTDVNVPALQPLLLQWEDSSAITIGGSDTNQAVSLFQSGGTEPWQQIYPNLANPVKPSSEEQAALVHGSDGSKILELYDFSVSPANVTQYILQSKHGKAAHTGDVPGVSSSRKRKRGITLQSWPTYNDKFAPDHTRSGFSLAQSEDGVIAITGGIKNRRQSVELFDVNKNSWINTSKFFGPSAHQVPIGHHPSGTHSHHDPQTTPNTAPSPSSSSNSTDDSHSNTTLILGATLGSILGFIAILIIILLILRHRRQKKRQYLQAQREQEEKHRLSFADRGDPFMKEIDAMGYHPHEPMIHVTPAAGQPGHHQRTDTRASENSTTHLVPKSRGGNQMNDAMEMGPIGEKPNSLAVPGQTAKKNSLLVPGGQRKRTSGWSRYFSGTELMSARTSQVKSARSSAVESSDPRKSEPFAVEAPDTSISTKRDTTSTVAQTHSPHRSLHDCNSHGPTQLPPLDMGQQFGADATDRGVDNRQSLERSGTLSSTHSSAPPSLTSDTLFSQEQEEQSTWTPVTKSEYTLPGLRNTATSSIYGASLEGGEPGPLYEQGPRLSVPGGPTGKMTSGASIIRPISEEDENQQQMMKPTIKQVNTMHPPTNPQQAIVQDDMRWLNLGGRN